MLQRGHCEDSNHLNKHSVARVSPVKTPARGVSAHVASITDTIINAGHFRAARENSACFDANRLPFPCARSMLTRDARFIYFSLEYISVNGVTF